MNTPSPLVPQGSLLEQQKNKSKSNLFIAVFTILAIHLVLFGGLLMQGCGRKKPNETANSQMANPIPPDTNTTAVLVNTNLPPISNTVPEVPTNQTLAQSNLVPQPPTGTQTTQTPQTPPQTETTGTTKDYTVVKNDTFAKIAKANNVGLKALEKANPNVDPRKLKVGMVIQVPTSASVGGNTSGTGASETGTAEGTTYTVKAGDNLTKVARAHGTTPKQIRALNNLTTDRLHVGQKLKLPAPKAGGSNTNSTAPSENDSNTLSGLPRTGGIH